MEQNDHYDHQDDNGHYDDEEESPENYPQDQLHNDYQDNEDYEDHNEVDYKLLSSKEARKKAEEDSRLLANRIALLKLEEKKAWKKIDETKKKAKQIIDQRRRNEKVTKERDQRRMEKERDQDRLKQKNQRIKEELQQSIQNRKVGHVKKVHEDVKHFKREMDDQKELLEYQKQEQYLRNTSRKQMIRNTQKEANEKKQRDMENKKLEAKRKLMDKIIHENQLRMEKESKVARLEQDELELIQNLQNTQLLQKAAYEELEKALDTGEEDL